MEKIGFHVERAITIKEDFTRPALNDERLSWAEIETFGQTYRVNISIDGLADSQHLPGTDPHGTAPDAERQKARQWVALCGLARLLTQDIKESPDACSKLNVSIPRQPAGCEKWTSEKLWQYVQQHLVGYKVREWRPGLWQARSMR